MPSNPRQDLKQRHKGILNMLEVCKASAVYMGIAYEKDHPDIADRYVNLIGLLQMTHDLVEALLAEV